MPSVSLEVKQRYWKKKQDAAPLIPCECGCGEMIKSVDRYGREAKFINGHNKRQYRVDGNPKTAANKRWKIKHREVFRIGARNRYRKKKLQLMKEFGNACAQCGLGYDGANAAIFEFHHEDPTQKDGIISVMLRNTSYANIVEEAKKCALLCAHCHILHHNGRW